MNHYSLPAFVSTYIGYNLYAYCLKMANRILKILRCTWSFFSIMLERIKDKMIYFWRLDGKTSFYLDF